MGRRIQSSVMVVFPSCGLRSGRLSECGIDDVAQEGVEHQQRPQRRAVVARAGLMVIDQLLQIACGRSSPVSPRRSPSSASRTRCRSGPRNQRASGTAKPIFGRYRISRGRRGSIAFLSSHLPSRPRSFSDDGSVRQPFDQRMVHQRLAHFERVRHAGAIDLGVDVADQIGLQVEVLDQRQRIVGLRACCACRRKTSTRV